MQASSAIPPPAESPEWFSSHVAAHRWQASHPREWRVQIPSQLPDSKASELTDAQVESYRTYGRAGGVVMSMTSSAAAWKANEPFNMRSFISIIIGVLCATRP